MGRQVLEECVPPEGWKHMWVQTILTTLVMERVGLMQMEAMAAALATAAGCRFVSSIAVSGVNQFTTKALRSPNGIATIPAPATARARADAEERC